MQCFTVNVHITLKKDTTEIEISQQFLKINLSRTFVVTTCRFRRFQDTQKLWLWPDGLQPSELRFTFALIFPDKVSVNGPAVWFPYRSAHLRGKGVLKSGSCFSSQVIYRDKKLFLSRGRKAFFFAWRHWSLAKPNTHLGVIFPEGGALSNNSWGIF